MSTDTPLMQQYKRIKAQHQDAIVFFRMGDFYETFYEDAQIASRVLGIALTTRDKNSPYPVPLAGVVYHAAQPYIAKLIRAGYKVAICEQVEDPKKAKGLVKREVVRVITPGTVAESALVEEKSNNYLASIVFGSTSIGFAVVDNSTGEFGVSEFPRSSGFRDLALELTRLQPQELLLSDSSSLDSLLDSLSLPPKALITRREEGYFKYEPAYKLLNQHFQVLNLDGFGLGGYREGVAAAGGLLAYLRETQGQALTHLQGLKVIQPQERLILDASTQKNLELITPFEESEGAASLFKVLDFTTTSAGARLLKQWLSAPLREVAEINRRLDGVEELYLNPESRRQILQLLKGAADLERILSRISLSLSNARDLVALRVTLEIVPEISKILAPLKAPILQDLYKDQGDHQEVCKKIAEALVESPPLTIKEGGLFKERYHAELDEFRRILRQGKDWIKDFEAQEKTRTGISSLKVKYNRVFGYYLEVTKSNLAAVPADYIRKQTIAGGERFYTPLLKEYEDKVLGAEERAQMLEFHLFEELRKEMALHIPAIQRTARALATVEVLSALAEAAAQYSYVRPQLNEGDTILIKEGRHPVLERQKGLEGFVPNDLEIDCLQQQIIIITGPNMAGKSTYMRQVALIVIMAQMGSFVPAQEAQIGVVDRIFTRIGALDRLSLGQSTFMVEMSEAASILHNATDKSLILLDEVGRGTSTYDGVSLAWALVEYLHRDKEKGPKVLFATHYHELTQLAQSLSRVKNYYVLVREWQDQIVFLRTVKAGASDRSYGIQVARLAGIPPAVISRAKEILQKLEGSPLASHQARKKASLSSKTEVQLPLFSGGEHPIIGEIKSLDIDSLSPKEALEYLYHLKQKTQE